MNAIHVSVNTNTVLVCKNLAEAQFRCMECCKAFISERHLAKHNQKRHGLTPYFMEGFERINPTSDSDRRLTEVTGRLEKALSLLEAKSVNSNSTESHHRPEDTVRENAQLVTPDLSREIPMKSPQKSLEVRRTVSLFTLPYDRDSAPIVDGWMTKKEPKVASSGDVRNNERDSGRIGDDFQKVSQLNDGLIEKSPPNGDTHSLHYTPEAPSSNKGTADDVVVDGSSAHRILSSPQRETHEGDSETPAEPRNHQVTSIEPLLLNLIRKLDTVFVGNRIVTNSGCQTTEPAVPALDIAAGRKSVRFSDSPMYIGSSEHHFNESESECSAQSSQSKFEDDRTDYVENHDFHTYTKCSGQNNVTRTVRKGPESTGESTIVYDERTRVLARCPGHDDIEASDSCHSPDVYESSDAKQDTKVLRAGTETLQETEQSCTDKDESENDYSQSRETAILLAPRTAAAAAPEPSATEAVDEDDSPRNPHPLTTQEVRKSADYVATKRQILDMVEKCVKDLKAKRKQPKAPAERPVAIQDHEAATPERQECPEVETANPQLPDVRNSSGSHLVCAGKRNITVDSQGILPPCTMIFKDEEVDIDEFSGDSYERFMKRFYSRQLQSDNDPNRSVIVTPDTIQDGADDQAGSGKAGPSPRQSPNPAGPVRLSPISAEKVEVKADLKKSEYALLLHHETSQVQSLIDTLVMDLQRWRNARRDKLSQAIRLQLEERLASNLNLLGVRSDAKLLPDSAATTARFLLNNRRSKLAKGSQSSYFDVVKYAFVNEVDRIAKSRVNDHVLPT